MHIVDRENSRSNIEPFDDLEKISQRMKYAGDRLMNHKIYHLLNDPHRFFDANDNRDIERAYERKREPKLREIFEPKKKCILDSESTILYAKSRLPSLLYDTSARVDKINEEYLRTTAAFNDAVFRKDKIPTTISHAIESRKITPFLDLKTCAETVDAVYESVFMLGLFEFKHILCIQFELFRAFHETAKLKRSFPLISKLDPFDVFEFLKTVVDYLFELDVVQRNILKYIFKNVHHVFDYVFKIHLANNAERTDDRIELIYAEKSSKSDAILKIIAEDFRSKMAALCGKNFKYTKTIIVSFYEAVKTMNDMMSNFIAMSEFDDEIKSFLMLNYMLSLHYFAFYEPDFKYEPNMLHSENYHHHEIANVYLLHEGIFHAIADTSGDDYCIAISQSLYIDEMDSENFETIESHDRTKQIRRAKTIRKNTVKQRIDLVVTLKIAITNFIISSRRFNEHLSTSSYVIMYYS